jgi:hypothetical protein
MYILFINNAKLCQYITEQPEGIMVADSQLCNLYLIMYAMYGSCMNYVCSMSNIIILCNYVHYNTFSKSMMLPKYVYYVDSR